MDGLYDLPPGWSWRHVGDIADVSGGGTPRRDEPKFYDGGAIPWATPSDIDPHRILPLGNTKTSITQEGLRRSSARLLPQGTVLFSSRASIGKIAVATESVATNQGFANLTPKDGVDSWYLAYALRAFTKEVSALGSGTTFLEVAKSSLREFSLPIPPLPEQQRLVEKIERLLEQSQTAREALDRIPLLLKRFRQSVLAKAFRGELTSEWREANAREGTGKDLLERIETMHASGGHGYGGKAAEPSEEGHDLDPRTLPSTWAAVELKLLCEPGRPITYGILKPGPNVPDGVPYVRVADFPQERIVLASVRRTSKSIADAYRRSALKAGDVLLSIRGTYGRVCSVPEELDGANVTQDTARVSLHGDIIATYIEYYLRSPDVQRRLAKIAKGVAVKGVNIGDVRALQVPLPSRAEQVEIAARVTALFAHVEAVEQRVSSAWHRAKYVDQAVLARAFRGEL